MEPRKFNYNGKQIGFLTHGEGPLVVLLHGFGEESMVWKNQYRLFHGYRLLIPDLPGSGASEMIEDMSMEGMAEMVYTLVSSLMNKEAGTITLIGHSMGGYIALAFAEKYPDALNAFGLFHSTAFADSEEKKEARKKGIAMIKQKGGFEFLEEVTPKLYAPATMEGRPGVIKEHLEMVRNVNADALVSYYEAMMQRRDRTAVLKNSTVPVLFIMGKYDTAVPLEDGLEQCHLPQVSYIHILQNSGHMGMIEETEESNKILSRFVTGVQNIAYT